MEDREEAERRAKHARRNMREHEMGQERRRFGANGGGAWERWEEDGLWGWLVGGEGLGVFRR